MKQPCRACHQSIREDLDVCPFCGAERPAQSAGAGAASPSPAAAPQAPLVGRRRRSAAPETPLWEQYLNHGLALLGEERWPDAITALGQAVAEAPEQHLARCYATRGYAFLSSSDFQRALDECNLALERDTSDSDAWAWRGSAQAGMRAWRRAIDDYARAIELAPDRSEEFRAAALAYSDQALAELGAVLKQGAAPLGIYQDLGVIHAFRGEHEKGARAFSLAVKENPQDSFSFFKRGECILALGQFQQAAADVTQSLRLGRKDAHSYYVRGTAFKATGRTDKAMTDLGRALQLDPNYAAAYFGRGQLHEVLGDPRAAAADYTIAITLAPASGEYFLARAACSAAAGDFNQAVADYTAAIERGHTSGQNFLLRGEALLELGQLAEAQADFDAMLAADPTCVAAFRGRGNVLARQGRLEEALSELTKAVRLDARYAPGFESRGEVLLQLERGEPATADFTKALQLAPEGPTTAETYHRRGLAQALLRRWPAALFDFTEAITRQPLHAEAHAQRGVTHAELRNYREAIEDIARAMELNPDDAARYLEMGRPSSEAAIEFFTAALASGGATDVHFLGRGVAREFQGKVSEALHDYSQAVAVNAANVDALYRRAAIQFTHKRYEAAVADYSRVIELDNMRSGAYHGRAAALRALGRLDPALEDATSALTLEPASGNLLLFRGQVLLQARKFERAERDLSAAIENQRRDARPWFYRGQVHAQQGRHEKAISDYTACLERDAHFVLAWLRRAESRVQLKRFAESAADYARALELAPHLVEIHISRSLALARRGKIETAILELTKALGRIRFDLAFAAALETRGRLWYSLGQYRRAIADFHRLAALKPPGVNLSTGLYGRGLAHVQLQEFLAAEQCFAASLQLAPHSDAARNALTWLRGDRKIVPAELRAPAKTVTPRVPPAARPPLAIVPRPEFEVDDPLWNQWLVHIPSGDEFGPVSKSELDAWCRAGRLSDQAMLLRIDWDEWRYAGEVYYEVAHLAHKEANRPIPLAATPAEPAAATESASAPLPDENLTAPPAAEADNSPGFPGLKL